MKNEEGRIQMQISEEGERKEYMILSSSLFVLHLIYII